MCVQATNYRRRWRITTSLLAFPSDTHQVSDGVPIYQERGICNKFHEGEGHVRTYVTVILLLDHGRHNCEIFTLHCSIDDLSGSCNAITGQILLQWL